MWMGKWIKKDAYTMDQLLFMTRPFCSYQGCLQGRGKHQDDGGMDNYKVGVLDKIVDRKWFNKDANHESTFIL